MMTNIISSKDFYPLLLVAVMFLFYGMGKLLEYREKKREDERKAQADQE